MKTLTFEIDEKFFNLLWRSLNSRENELQTQIAALPEDSDEVALLGNDIVYLRLCQKSLEEKARAVAFSEGSFLLDENFLDLSDHMTGFNTPPTK